MQDTTTLGDFLGITTVEAAGVGFYDVGTEPVMRRRRRETKPRGRRRPLRELNRYLGDARAGASDAEIARVAGVSAKRVQRWRTKRGLLRPRGRPSTMARATSAAMDLFGRPFEPVVTRVESRLRGGFEPPEYLVRQPLDYSRFLRCIGILNNEGLDVAFISSAVGVDQRAVEQAIALGGS